MFVPDLKTDLPRSTKTKNMKNNLLTLATILTIGFFTNSVNAQTTKGELSTPATANARLVKLMTLEEEVQLDFGTILLNSGATSAETFTLTPAGILTEAAGGLHKISSTTGKAATAGEYKVTGTKNAVYFVALPASGEITVTTGAAGVNETMIINNLKLKFNNENAATSATATTNKLTNVGDDTFSLGGDLTIGTGQQEGVYTGSYNVSVDYN
jgi:hypothetical protein